jgi:hypothetical protein
MFGGKEAPGPTISSGLRACIVVACIVGARMSVSVAPSSVTLAIQESTGSSDTPAAERMKTRMLFRLRRKKRS